MAKRGLHSDVLDLGRRIVGRDLPPGSVLTLDAVDAECAVDRSVSREAVRVLESMGMLASRQRVGVTVLPAPTGTSSTRG